MKRIMAFFSGRLEDFLNKFGLGMRTKLILIFLVVKVIPLVLVTLIALRQISVLGNELRRIAVGDSTAALNDSAIENIERMTTDTAHEVADFLYERDDDIRYLASIPPSEETYRQFLASRTGRLVQPGEWALAGDEKSWVPVNRTEPETLPGGVSHNTENNDKDGFHYREPDNLAYQDVPLYDEITFVDLQGNELIKAVAQNSPKTHYPLSPEKRNVSLRENTFVKAETYFAQLGALKPGEIYVSDVIGAHVASNYIGLYVPEVVAKAAADRGYDIPYAPETQAYAGRENPNGRRFEGIVRWATPVADAQGQTIGYVTFALNHDHIMEFVDHQTPMNQRYTELPSAFEGNYAFIWDYKCRNICHPRHHSIAGYDPETGDPEIPWLESSIYEAWQASGVPNWFDYVQNLPTFDQQSRSKKLAPALTKAGLVGLDGRYLNNAPQCTGWMDLTVDGGSGSFYILWSGLYKLTTAGAIPYYTGQYAPSEANGFSRRGFGIVTIGAGLEDFTRPSTETEVKLTTAIDSNLGDTFTQLLITNAIIILLVVLIAIGIASSLTGNIKDLIGGISRFRAGERQFRFRSSLKNEFGTLADSFDEMADSIVDSVKNGLCIIDIHHNILYMNDAGLTLCGKTLKQIEGTPYGHSSVYPSGSAYDPLLALEQGREADIYFVPGLKRYIRGTANLFYSKDGEQIGFMVQSVDVTEMVLKQMQIEEQRTLLDQIFSASPDLIWYMDTEGRYLAVNPRFAAICGQAPEAFIGKTAAQMLPTAMAQSFDENDRKTIEARKPLYSEDALRFADGHEEVLDSVRTPILDPGGHPVGLLGFARNVNKRVTIENELRSTQIELEQAVYTANRANEHKGDFLARMSHEIRTPMNAIIGITNIVQKKLRTFQSDSEELADIAGHMCQIETSSQHLLGLLNDILDISKIEAGKIELSDEIVELPKLAATVVNIIKPRCDEKNIAFPTFFDALSPSAFRCDPLRLRQVLINLLGNAVKFTPECGTVEFHMRRLDRRGGKTLLQFVVRDTGVGISPEAMANIFKPFEQGNARVARQYGGSGLGLTISQNIVRLFGSEIEVASQVGVGSEFRFSIWLPEAQSDQPAEQVTSALADELAGKRILLVDDVEINRMIVMTMLESNSLSIDEADDGSTAVQAFQASPIGTYDAILMDVQMPMMDGYEASSVIRALGRPDAKTVPIIALTANAFKEDIDKAISSGMNAHIAKPVELDKLLEVLYRFLAKGK